MVDWYLGTMGFSYKDWEGSFYPAEIKPRRYLDYYAGIFNAVEIDSTFYGVPPISNIQRWISQTPEGFKICTKLPRTITHNLGLSGTQGLVDEFLGVMRSLKNRLGIILIQFPPSFKDDQFLALASFLESLPSDIRFACEVRHPSWHNDRYIQLLTKLGVAYTANEYANLPRCLYQTTGFLYVRWIGYHLRFQRHDREQIDPSTQLAWWWDALQPYLGGVNEIFGFFNNDYAGFSPGTCNRFKSLVGLTAVPLVYPKQERLF